MEPEIVVVDISRISKNKPRMVGQGKYYKTYILIHATYIPWNDIKYTERRRKKHISKNVMDRWMDQPTNTTRYIRVRV